MEVVVVENFLQLPEHMRGVEVENEAGKVDDAWIRMYPGALFVDMCTGRLHALWATEQV